MAKRPKGGRKGKRQKPTKHDRLGPRLVPPRPPETPREPTPAEFAARKRELEIRHLVELDATDLEILKLHLSHPWMTQEQIGQHEKVRLGRQAVNERMGAEKFKRAFGQASRSALEIFEGNKAAAARKLGTLINSEDDRVAIRAAIAHMWPEIHQGQTGKGEDFVSFIQEAFERAQQGAEPTKAAGE